MAQLGVAYSANTGSGRTIDRYGTDRIVNCLFSDNTNAGNGTSNFYNFDSVNPKITSLGGNVSSEAADAGTLNHAADQTGVSGFVGPLQVNTGGLVSTHSIGSCSPAYNAGVTSATGVSLPTTDANNQPRLGPPDAGAFEVQEPTSVSVSASNSGTLTCANPSLTLTATLSGGTNATYAFAGPGLSTTSTSSTATASQEGTFTLTAQSAEGCVASATVALSSNTLTPGISLSAPNGQVLTCSTSVLTLSASSPTGTASFSFVGPAITNTAPAAISLNAEGTYSVTAINPANGCISSTTTSIGSDTAPPGVSLTATNGGVLTCLDPVLTLTASSTTSAVSFSFSGPAITTTTPSAIGLNGEGAYSVTATNAVNGCRSSTSLSISSTIESIDISLSATNGGIFTCGVETLILTANSSFSAVSYGFASVNSFTQVNNSLVLNSAGTYSVTAINPITSCYSVTSLSIGINLAPPSALAVTRRGTIGCGPNSETLTASASGATSYTLFPGGESNSNGVFVVTAIGIYTLTASNGVGPSCQSQAIIAVTQGINAVAGSITVSGPASCTSPARLTAPSTGQSFVFTGPNGYVFSNVYRNGGSYTAFAEGVKLGGTYTLTASGGEGCPTTTSTIVVQGPTTCP